MKDWFDKNHPRYTENKVTALAPTFMCFKCKTPHMIPGSKQVWSSVLRKFKRYCRPCWEETHNG